MQEEINLLEKLYLSVFNNKNVLKSHMLSEVLVPLNTDVQKKILEVTIYNKICKLFSPPDHFKKMFLRTLLDAVESYGTEQSEELLSEYANILSIPSKENIGYCSYLMNENCIITLQENSCFVAKSTTGLQTWEASKYLSEWCIRNSSKFKDKKILELGSGIGLLGLVVIKLCHPKKYIFTDKSWEVLNILSSNLAINISQMESYDIQLAQLVWATTCEDDASNFSHDIILGADLVYDTSMIESLVHALEIFLSKGSCAYIASTIRDPDTNKKFLFHLGISNLYYRILEKHEQSHFIYNPLSSFILYEIRSNKNLQ